MEVDFLEFYRNKKVLITGDTGFKGSWLSILLKELGAEIYGYSLAPESPEDNYVSTGLAKRIHHTDGNIRDSQKLNSFINDTKPDLIFHLAAQSLVLRSYEQAAYTYEVNLQGTVNILEATRSNPSVMALIVVTSDKCYQNIGVIDSGYREEDALGGDDPYSASKACAEIATQSYIKSFFQEKSSTNVASARAGNVIGGGDWSENRIVPDIFRAIRQKTPLSVRNPQSIRPWQFVLEPLFGYIKLAYKLTQDKAFQGAWNFGPDPSLTYSVDDLVREVAKYVKDLDYHKGTVDTAKREAEYLRLNIDKSLRLLGWKPLLNFADTVGFTCEGYLAENNSDQIYESRIKQIHDIIKIL
jgi:CDP-glucose 4,6-dehydratase